MKKLIILLIICVTLGCSENNKNDYFIDDYKTLIKREDSLRILLINLKNENDFLKNSLDSLKKTQPNDNIIKPLLPEISKSSGKYGYIKNFKKKYPSDVNLYTKGELNKSLLKLLGKKNYEIFINNMSVQGPIDIINDEYTLLSGNAPHSGGFDEAGILIDFRTNKISVGILKDRKEVLYFTENDNKSLKHITSEFQLWMMDAYEIIGKKLWEQN